VTFAADRVKSLRVLGRYGAIGSLGGAIEYAFGMGLISDHEKHDAVVAKDIRNRASHSLASTGLWTFDTDAEEMRKTGKHEELRWDNPIPATWTRRYAFCTVAGSLASHLLIRVYVAQKAIAADANSGRTKAIGWLLGAVSTCDESVYLARFDAGPASTDPFPEGG
jgi:hypothetical protein